MTEKPVCDYPGCGEVGEIISRLSPEGYLVATGKKARARTKTVHPVLWPMPESSLFLELGFGVILQIQ